MTIFYTFYQSFPLPTNSSWFFQNFQCFISRGKKYFSKFATFQTFNKICNLSHFLPNFSTLHKFQLIFPKFSIFHFMRGKNHFSTLFYQIFPVFPQIPADFSKIFHFSFYAVKYFFKFFKIFATFQTFNKIYNLSHFFTKFFHFPQIPADFSKIFNFSFYAWKKYFFKFV